VNLLTVATFNLVTDLTLILFPIPILWRTTQLNFWVYVSICELKFNTRYQTLTVCVARSN
jgi:hypothetical protein